ncbi:MAG: acetylxylan esterase [Planctomycetota bacterium]
MQTFSSHVDGYYDVSDQMIDHLRRRAERCFRRREAERAALKTRADADLYRARMLRNFLHAIGGLPKERTPLDPAITGTLDRGAYVIEKLIYHSLPNFPVTANLYMPKSRRGQAPGAAVLFVCGHAEEAKAHENYQKVCIALAQAGILALSIDPPGQGERFQFLDEQTGFQRVQWGTTEHTYAGMQYYMAGLSIARHFVWDGIRGVDYLLTRPEVDPQRIGVTGSSGGGTQTCYLMVAEPRLAAAMPCTFVMDYESYLKTGQPQDGEQNLYGCFSDGPDHDDYIAVFAPKPVHLGLAAYDFFPIEGALETFARARRFYALFGPEAPQRLGYTIAPTTHSYSACLRKAAVEFFTKALVGEKAGGTPALPDEPETLPREALNVTATGQVLRTFPQCRTVSALLREELAHIAPALCKHAPKLLRTMLAEALGIGETSADLAQETAWIGPPRERPIYPRIISDEPVDGYRTEKIFFFSEPDVCVTAVLVHARGAPRSGSAGVPPALGAVLAHAREAQPGAGGTPALPGKAVLVPPHPTTEILLLAAGSDAIPAEHARLLDILEQGRNVFVFDVRGSGGVKTRQITSTGGEHNTEFRLGCDAMKMKTSTLGLRVFDVLRAIDYLSTRQDTGPISLTGVGVAGAWALYAAALEPRVAALRLERAPLSYRAAAATRYYDAALVNFRSTAWGLLRVADVAELLAALAPRPVTFVQPCGATGVPLDRKAIESEFLRPAEEAGLIGTKAGGWRPEFA